MPLTEPLFFDTDCLSAFLWVRNESLLSELYPGRVIIPEPVYIELSRPNIKHLKTRVDSLISSKLAEVRKIDIGSDEFLTYYRLTEEPAENHKIIGHGEAAAISLAVHYGGIVASNNLRDIQTYIMEFGLDHTTTADILVDAYKRKFITKLEGDTIWAEMMRKRRRLGADSFSSYLEMKNL